MKKNIIGFAKVVVTLGLFGLFLYVFFDIIVPHRNDWPGVFSSLAFIGYCTIGVLLLMLWSKRK